MAMALKNILHLLLMAYGGVMIAVAVIIFATNLHDLVEEADDLEYLQTIYDTSTLPNTSDFTSIDQLGDQLTALATKVSVQIATCVLMGVKIVIFVIIILGTLFNRAFLVRAFFGLLILWIVVTIILLAMFCDLFDKVDTTAQVVYMAILLGIHIVMAVVTKMYINLMNTELKTKAKAAAEAKAKAARAKEAKAKEKGLFKVKSFKGLHV